MLTAITKGKAGRIWLEGAEHSVNWRDVFRRSEDLLTAAIFSRVRYLSPALLTHFMAQLIGTDGAKNLGPLVQLDFWRNLEGTHGRVRVQPDVLMWFANALVIVEVKPPFGGNQTLGQWQAQLHAVAHMAKTGGEDAVPQRVYFTGLGRNTFSINEHIQAAFTTDDVFDLSLHTAEWSDITDALAGLRNEATATDSAVLDDWLSALELFGMVKPTYTWPALVEWAAPVRLSLHDLPSPPPQAPLATAPKADAAPQNWDALIRFNSNYPLALCR